MNRTSLLWTFAFLLTLAGAQAAGNIVSYQSFDNAFVNSTHLIDTTGNYNATKNSQTAIQTGLTGKVGQAVNFTGANATTTNPLLTQANASAWGWVYSISGTRAFVVGTGTSAFSGGLDFNTAGSLNLWVNGSNGINDANTTHDDAGTWHWFGIRKYANNTYTLFYNGTVVQSATFASLGWTNVGNTIKFCGQAADAICGYGTEMDEWGFSNLSLTDAQYSCLFNNGAGTTYAQAQVCVGDVVPPNTLDITAKDAVNSTTLNTFSVNITYQNASYWPLQDTSINRFNLTNTNNTRFINTTAFFNSSNGTMLNAATPVFDIGNYTYSLWIDPTSAQNLSTAVFALMNSSENNPSLSASFLTNMTIQCAAFLDFTNGTATSAATAASTVTVGSWQHVLCEFTYSGGAVNISEYFNNALTSSATASNIGWFDFNKTQGIRLGSQKLSTRFYNGSEAQVRLWNRTLSAAEKTTVYNNGTVLDGLIASYDFNESGNVSYSTTTGAIATNITASIANITVGATNYFTATYQNVNVSTSDLQANLTPYWRITLFNLYDNQSLSTFSANVTYQGATTTYSTTNGNIYAAVPMNSSGGIANISIGAPNYFIRTLFNINSSSALNTSVYAVVARYSATEIISGTSVTSFTVTTTNTSNTNTTPTLYLNPGTYTSVFNKTGYFNMTGVFTYAALDNVTSNFTGVYAYLLNLTARNNLTNVSITTYNITISSNEYVYSTTASTTNGTINLPLTNGTYNITASANGYSTSNFNLTVNTTGIVNNVLYLYPNPSSIFIYIFDESTGLLINNTAINITASGTLGDTTNTTSSGIGYISNLTAGTYSVKLAGGNYSLRSYTVTLGTNQTVTLYAYLPLNAQLTTFQVRDVTTGTLLQGLTVVAQRSIGGVFTTVDSKITDISGTSTFNYIPLVRYQFIVSGTATNNNLTYQTNTFILDPVNPSNVFPSSYDVPMVPTNIYTNAGDYDTVLIFTTPSLYYSPAVNNFTITFISPTGTFINYTYTLTYPGGTSSGSGNSITGSTLLNTVNLTTANFTDTVNLTYTYTSTQFSGTKTFSTSFPILTNSSTPNTWAALCTTSYGLGDLEKAGITIIGTGVLAAAGQAAAGGAGAGTLIVLALFASYKLCITTFWSVALALMTGILIIILGENFL